MLQNWWWEGADEAVEAAEDTASYDEKENVEFGGT